MFKKILVLVLLVLFQISLLTASDEKKSKTSATGHSSGQHHVSGTVGKVRENRIVVRVGDASRNYSFDNNTVFTYGDEASKASSLKEGDEIVVTVTEEDKVVEVNGTKRIEAIVQSIDVETETLTVKIGDKHKQFPFSIFRLFKMDGDKIGPKASVLEMKEGDSVFIRVNVAFPKLPFKKKVEK